MKTTLLGATALLALASCSQQSDQSSLSKIDAMVQTNLTHAENADRYVLYPTENIYTFLQLDTKTGMIEQVQWSLEAENEGSVVINDTDLSDGKTGKFSGIFTLYPTKNLYQFILLNKTNGKKWHVQWGFEAEKRWIREM